MRKFNLLILVLELDESNWNISKACCYLASILMKFQKTNFLDQQMILFENECKYKIFFIKKYLKLVHNFLRNFQEYEKQEKKNSDEWGQISKNFILCNIILNISIESVEKDAFINFIEFNLQKYLHLFSQFLNNSNFNLFSFLISWNLSKLSEFYIENIGKNKIYHIIQLFYNLINNFSKIKLESNDEFFYYNIKIMLMNVLINSLKFYGDKITEKPSTIFSHFNKKIIYDIFQNLNIIYRSFDEQYFTDEETQMKSALKVNMISIYIEFLNKLIEFSADDFQEIIEEVLSYIVKEYEEISFIYDTKLQKQNQFKIDSKKIKETELLNDFQNNLISTINIIFGKINRLVSDEICFNIFNFLMKGTEIYRFNSTIKINCLGFIILSK